jgi:hypothetical protein
MDKTPLLCSIIANSNQSKGRKSSLLKEWLGRDISQSLSIRFGYYLEQFFNALIPDSLIGDNEFRVVYNGEQHQVDVLAIIDGVVVTREVKLNVEMDRGKKRDVLSREHAITKALEEQFGLPVDNKVMCPFFINNTKVSGLGEVEGLTEFLKTFKIDMTVEQFIEMGKSNELHRLF